MKRKYLSFLLIFFILFSLTACGSSKEVAPTIVPQKTNDIDYGQYSKIEIEPKEFTWGTYDLLYTNQTFPKIIEDYQLVLSTSSDIDNFPEIKEKLTIKNTNPQLVIIPRHFQVQYTISEITCKNGIISIIYETTNNIKIDRVIGQIYDVPYTISYVDLGILPDGKYRIEFKDKNKHFEDTIKEIDIIIPELITEWDIKNISYAGDNYITYSSNKTGDWQIYRYDFLNKNIVQVSDHTDAEISGLNDLGFNNDINIPRALYNKSLNSIYYSINSDIYRFEDLGDNIFRKFNISLESMQTNKPNDYYIFEKDPILSKSGYKYLFLEVSDPAENELFVGETFDQGKKQKIFLPTIGTVEYFNFGKTENEYIVVISPTENERVNGNSTIWVLRDNFNSDNNTKVTTNGYKIHSADVSSDKKFIIFSQKLASTEGYNKYNLYYANLNNTELKRITPKDDLRDINPVISPDNKKVAYMSSENGSTYKLFVANINGSDRRQVSNLYITDKPYWLNNFEILIVDPFANIIKVNIETGDTEHLIDGFDKLDIEKEKEKLEQMKLSE